MADLHLCRCPSGPHPDMPVTVLDAGSILVMRDPNRTVSLPDLEGGELHRWAEGQGMLIVLVHDPDVRLTTITDEQLDSIGLMRRANMPVGEPPEADDGG